MKINKNSEYKYQWLEFDGGKFLMHNDPNWDVLYEKWQKNTPNIKNWKWVLSVYAPSHYKLKPYS